jgi:hypothetical protein
MRQQTFTPRRTSLQPSSPSNQQSNAPGGTRQYSSSHYLPAQLVLALAASTVQDYQNSISTAACAGLNC